MGRRRRSRDDDTPDIFAVAWVAPTAGFAIAAVIVALGVFLKWFVSVPKFPGITGPFGVFCFWVAGFVALISASGWLRNYFKRSKASSEALSLTINSIHALTWQQFEQMVADLFRRQGYRVEETGKQAGQAGRGDGGVDLILHRDGDVAHLVQCKQYRSWKVGEPNVREFFGAMAAHHTRCEGIFITCGRFTDEARRFVTGKPVRLIDGDELLALLRSVNPLTPAVEQFTTPPTVSANALLPASASTTAPQCPSCAIPMVRRVARQGANRGRSFWGCNNYPKCREIRQV